MRHSVKSRLLGLVGSLMLGAGVLVATGGPAEASSPCPGSLLENVPITGGYISVYYNSATGRNCALTYTNHPGVAQQIYAEIGQWDGGARDVDGGTYKYYAGPVSVYAPHECIYVEGRVGTGNYEAVGPIFCD